MFMNDDRCCGNCIWWKQLPEGFKGSLVAPLKTPFDGEQLEKVTDNGQCRRWPPRISERTASSGKRQPMVFTLTEFPDTPRTAWCGEFGLKTAEGKVG